MMLAGKSLRSLVTNRSAPPAIAVARCIAGTARSPYTAPNAVARCAVASSAGRSPEVEAAEERAELLDLVGRYVGAMP